MTIQENDSLRTAVEQCIRHADVRKPIGQLIDAVMSEIEKGATDPVRRRSILNAMGIDSGDYREDLMT